MSSPLEVYITIIHQGKNKNIACTKHSFSNIKSHIKIKEKEYHINFSEMRIMSRSIFRVIFYSGNKWLMVILMVLFQDVLNSSKEGKNLEAMSYSGLRCQLLS